MPVYRKNLLSRTDQWAGEIMLCHMTDSTGDLYVKIYSQAVFK